MKILYPLIVALAVGCSTNSDPQTPETDVPVSGGIIEPGFTGEQTIDILNDTRSYNLYLPSNPASAELVLLLHGNGGSSKQLLGMLEFKAPYKLWIDIALRENLILIVPDGAVGSEGRQGWNDCRTDAPTNPTTDDVLFLSTLIDAVSVEYKKTLSKTYVVGTSNGGIMAQRLADEIPEKLHAIASVVASRPINSGCPDTTMPVSALIMNGTADPILPYEGGHIKPQRGELFSTNDAVAYWVNRNQTNTALTVDNLDNIDASDNSEVSVYSYTDGTNKTRVMHYEVVNGGHTEPSIEERYSPLYKLLVGEQNNDIEMADEIWRFFDSL